MKTTRRQFMAGSAAATAGMLLAQHAAAQTGEPSTNRPNIVLIFADDVGYGDLSCYGHPTIHTPKLDQLAAEGARFTSFYANPACTPARAALMTGRYPVRPGGVASVLGPDSNKGLPADEITIATALKGEGYRTKCVGKWHLGHADEEFMPTSHGFDEYFGLLYSNDMIQPWVNTDEPLELYRDTEPVEHPVDQYTLTTRYTEEAVRFIRDSADEPFFLYLAHTMAHMPLATAERFEGQSRAGLYGDVIEALDWSAGEVMDALREAGVADNTLIIWLSDNGPWINMPDRMVQEGPDGLDNERWHAGSPGPFREAKGTTYEGGVRVPAIVWWPEEVPSDRVIQEPANSMDLFTTILRAGGAEIPDDRPIDGNDLWPLLRGETEESPTQVYHYFRGGELQAVRKGPWKLRLATGEPELFHLDRDYMERFNVAEDYPDKVEELRALMEDMAEETGSSLP
ncbi:MAG: sulfatase-like hydrolase/transferase [Candidatus Hydrogenedentota bacterium]